MNFDPQPNHLGAAAQFLNNPPFGGIEQAGIFSQSAGMTNFKGYGDGCGGDSHFSHLSNQGFHASTYVNIPGVGRYKVDQNDF